MVGIIQEQHPDRTRLFMQWKRMEWPILVDSLNLLQVTVVPMTLFIDEWGIIRAIQPRRADAESFLDTNYPKPADLPAGPRHRAAIEKLKAATEGGNADAFRAYGDAMFLWGDKIDETIESYRQAVRLDPGDGPTQFRLGVAYRKRYDSTQRLEGDFANAVQHWGRALEIDPNQYIWRRRIQQYGPRLDKPYPFYDWVVTAREEITTRGDTPLPLSIEPGGAEFTHPARRFVVSDGSKAEPDPGARILRDEKGFVDVEVTVVPSVIKPGKSGRIHVVLRPNRNLRAHWNNEVGDLVYWVNAPEDWKIDTHYLSVARPQKIVSQEERKVEFELKSPANFTGTVRIPSYALYYVCEDVNGTCLYRRKDITIDVPSRQVGGEEKRHR